MTEDAQHIVDGLFGQLVDLIGLGWTLRLCQDFGGTEVYFPKRIATDHPVARSIGIEPARRVAAFAGQGDSGGTLDLPRGVKFDARRRNDQILEDLQTGLSKKDIALKYGLTTRWVRHLCNSTEDERQINLL